MTIQEYYDNYKINSKYDKELDYGEDLTVEDFYKNCIAKHTTSSVYINNAKAWHDMLVKYIEQDDAVFWIRYHENGPKDEITGRYKTRRACKTVFQDGFSYVFVSNYDAHEIFNMVRLGVKPDLDEFKNLMKNNLYQLHFDKSDSCEESDICAYPNIGSVRGGILTPYHLYLAHIIGVKSDVYIDRKTKKRVHIDSETLYPRGEVSEWKTTAIDKVREINRTLSIEEKNIIKAHFLRFVDPLNYYIVPGKKYQESRYGGQIGEISCVNNYVREQYRALYQGDYDLFEELAMAPGSNELYITYGTKKKTANAAKGGSNTGGTSSVEKIKRQAKPKNEIDLTGISHAYLNTFKVGEIAYQVLGAILNSGRLSEDDVDLFKRASETRKVFGFKKPLLSPVMIRTSNSNRYYADPFTLHGEKLFLYSQWQKTHKERLIKWILKWISDNGPIV